MATSSELWRLALVVVAVLLLLPVVMMLFAMPMMGYGWWMHGPAGADGAVAPGGFAGGMPWWMVAFWLAGLVALAGLGYFVYRAVSNAPRTDPALEELRRAYARGDLSDEEFETRREELRRE